MLKSREIKSESSFSLAIASWPFEMTMVKYMTLTSVAVWREVWALVCGWPLSETHMFRLQILFSCVKCQIKNSIAQDLNLLELCSFALTWPIQIINMGQLGRTKKPPKIVLKSLMWIKSQSAIWFLTKFFINCLLIFVFSLRSLISIVAQFWTWWSTTMRTMMSRWNWF